VALAIVFDGLTMHTDSTGPYIAVEPIDIGSQEVADALLGGDFLMEEVDQVAAELGVTRSVTIPMSIRSASADAALAAQTALTSRLAAATRYGPKVLTITPNNATKPSTFSVFGGSWKSDYTQTEAVTNRIDGTVTFLCDWPIWGVAENLGSSGSPLVSNAASPANVTLTPTVVGDVPSDVVLFVVNRHASKSARCLIVSAVSGNTSWTSLLDSTGWTVGADGARDTTDATTKNTDMIKKTGTFTQDQIYAVASWNVPTLPTDRRFGTRLRVKDASVTARGVIQFRLRHVSGATEVVGSWKNLPVEATGTTWQLARMGEWPYPLGQISSVGASATTTFLEVRARGQSLAGAAGIMFDYALYSPVDSTVVFETIDTGKVMAAPAGTVRVESDQVFSTTGDTVAMVDAGSHVRARGTSRYNVLLSEGFRGALDSSIYFFQLSVDVYAIVTPRFIHWAS
jgi:hypothetical protein